MLEQGWSVDQFTDVWHFFVNGRCLCRSAFLWGGVVKRDVHASDNCPECKKLLTKLRTPG